MGLSDDQMRGVLAEADLYRCALSFHAFVKQAWPIIEPGNPFVSGWAVECMAEHLQAVTEGKVTRLLINVPPGLSKSTLVNVFWPAWEWGPRGHPEHKFISASYERGLAVRDMGRCRDLIRSEWFQQRWPLLMKQDQDEKTLYQNLNTGWRLAASVGGRMTGFRGDRIIIDDPHDVKRAESDTQRGEALRWATETVGTRYNHQSPWVDSKGKERPRSAQVIIMQRLHERDVSGLVLEQLMNEDDWTVLILPMEFEEKHRSWTSVPTPPSWGEPKPKRMRRVKEADEPIPHYVPDPDGAELYCQDQREAEGDLLFPERFDADAVAALKTTLRAHGGTYAEAAQLQQRPSPRGGGAFRRDAFKFWDTGKVLEPSRQRVRAWDLAASTKSRSAFTAGVLMSRLSNGWFIVEDVVRGRWEPFDVEQQIKSCADADGPHVRISIPQDPGAAGKGWKDHMAAMLAGYDVRFSPESGDKDYRANPYSAQVAAGMVYLLPGSWNPVYLSEAASFGPGAAYKDQIDASSRAFAELLKEIDPDLALLPGTLIIG